VGRLVTGKGLMPFIKALNQAVMGRLDLHIEFIIVGYGPTSHELAEADVCDRLRVMIMGSIPFESRFDAYCKGRVFVFPTFSDEWGQVVCEAMASGLPVCGSIYSQAVTELVEPGWSGWCFDPFDTTNMAHAINQMLDATEVEVNSMGQHARERVSSMTAKRSGEEILQAIVLSHRTGHWVPDLSYPTERWILKNDPKDWQYLAALLLVVGQILASSKERQWRQLKGIECNPQLQF
jgi:glycosyltransferase involved in cell wall biosynthesis